MTVTLRVDLGARSFKKGTSHRHTVKGARFTMTTLPDPQRALMWARLDVVRHRCSDNLGDGVGEEMEELLSEQGGDA